jgi:hydrogenase maturation protease
MKRVLIAGIGNVLLGDDGVGPCVVRQLDSTCSFDEGVELEDLGTPALDFIDHIAGLDALIVVDSVDNGKTPGTITLYRKQDLLRTASSVRMDTHSPAIAESLLAADVFFGMPPREVLLIGISAESYAAGCNLSESVGAAIDSAVQHVLAELARLNISYQKKQDCPSNVWWSAVPHPQPA